jgi:uncharacterized protein with von Willebrand factor type A (vWA) domain
VFTLTPALRAALIRSRDAENEFDAAWAAVGVRPDGIPKTLRINNPLRQRCDDANEECDEAHKALIAVLRKAV